MRIASPKQLLLLYPLNGDSGVNFCRERCFTSGRQLYLRLQASLCPGYKKQKVSNNRHLLASWLCGERGIRTPGTVTRSPHFECGPFDHSGISPLLWSSSGCKYTNFSLMLYPYSIFFFAHTHLSTKHCEANYSISLATYQCYKDYRRGIYCLIIPRFELRINSISLLRSALSATSASALSQPAM